METRQHNSCSLQLCLFIPTEKMNLNFHVTSKALQLSMLCFSLYKAGDLYLKIELCDINDMDNPFSLLFLE